MSEPLSPADVAAPPDTASDDAAKSEFAARFKTYTAADLLTAPKPRAWVVKGWLPKGKVGHIAAGGGAGKTSVIAKLATDIAAGRDFYGNAVMEGGVAIITTEDGYDDFREKFVAIRENTLGFDADKVSSNLAILDFEGHPLQLVDCDRGKYFVTSAVDDLANIILERLPNIQLIVVETVSRVAGGDESNAALSMLVVACEKLARTTQAHVLLVAHVSKAAAREGQTDGYASRGGAALHDNARVVLNLSRLDEKTAEALTGEPPPPEVADELVVLSNPKNNYARKQRSIVLERIQTDWGITFREFRSGTAVLSEAEARRVSRAVRGRTLRDAVARLVARGETVSVNKLSMLKSEHGFGKNSVPDLVQQAKRDGWLVEGPQMVQGRGYELLPGYPDCHDQSPGNLPNEVPPSNLDEARGLGGETKSPNPTVLEGGVTQTKYRRGGTATWSPKSPESPTVICASRETHPGDWTAPPAEPDDGPY